MNRVKAVKVKKLYDGSKSGRIDDAIVVFTEKIIDVVTPEEIDKLNNYNITEIIDFQNKYMLPGLIDAHVHLVLPGDGTPGEALLAMSKGEIQIVALKNAITALENGITTLRDCGGIPEIVFSLKETIDKGIITGPDLILCGSSITSTGGHTHFFNGEVDGVDNIRYFVRKQFKMGADFVKIIATEGGTKGVVPWGINFTLPEINAAVEEAHRLEMKATAHVTVIEGVRQVLQTNIDGLEHGYFLRKDNSPEFDSEIADEIAERGIYICPTLQALCGKLKQLEDIGNSRTEAENKELDYWRKFIEGLMQIFTKQLESGIDFIAGSDAGWRINPFGELVKGLELMVQGGMSNMEAINSATAKAAGYLNVSDRLGSIKPGLQADFIIVDDDPVDDIGNLRKINGVYKKGKKFINHLN